MLYRNKLIASALLLLASAPVIAAADFGYCSDAVSRNQVFRIGDSETQGMAIKLSAEKLQMLKGCSVSGLSAVFGSKRTTDGKIRAFVAVAPDAQPLLAQEFDINDAVKWVNFEFTDRYVITGDEPALFVGYTAEINNKSSMLMADHEVELEGCSYLYNDGQWVDTYGLGYGNVSLRVNIADAPEVADLMLIPVAAEGYFKAGLPYVLSGRVYNFGSVAVNSFDVKVTVGDEAPVVTNYTGINVPQGTNYEIQLPTFSSATEGVKSLSIEVVNVNGAADADVSDNALLRDMFYYPSNMERAILLEGFTGQKCSNCPSGHATIGSFVESINPSEAKVIEVMHHSGYEPDYMSMDIDYDYTYFFGGSQTFAPAVMLNRHYVPSVAASPVMNVDKRYLETAYAALSNVQPYVSMGIVTTFDPATRQVSVSVESYAHADLPSDQNIINVLLVQNGVRGYQLPIGENYVHDAVCRGSLTGNAWGVLLSDDATKQGGSAQWSATFDLPEAIFSDFWDASSMTEAQQARYSIPTVPEDMYVVAYVAAYADGDVNAHDIYNAVSAPLGQSYVQQALAVSPIVMPDKAKGADFRVEGRSVVVDGDYDSLQVYSLDGMAVDAQSALTPGLYIVRVSRGTDVSVGKVLVR